MIFLLKKKIQTMPECQADATRTSLFMYILIAILQNILLFCYFFNGVILLQTE